MSKSKSIAPKIKWAKYQFGTAIDPLSLDFVQGIVLCDVQKNLDLFLLLPLMSILASPLHITLNRNDIIPNGNLLCTIRDGSNLISTINDWKSFIINMRFEPSNAWCNGSARAQHACAQAPPIPFRLTTTSVHRCYPLIYFIFYRCYPTYHSACQYSRF